MMQILAEYHGNYWRTTNNQLKLVEFFYFKWEVTRHKVSPKKCGGSSNATGQQALALN